MLLLQHQEVHKDPRALVTVSRGSQGSSCFYGSLAAMSLIRHSHTTISVDQILLSDLDSAL